MTQKTNNQKGEISMILMFIVGLLLVSNLLTIYYLYLKSQEPPAEKIVIQKIEESAENNDDLDLDISKNEEEIKKTNNNQEEEIETEKNEEEAEEDTQEVEVKKEDLTGGEILVEWNEWPGEITYSGFFGRQSFTLSSEETKFIDNLKIYKIGKITEGNYIGDELYLIKYRPMTMAFQDNIHRIIKTKDDFIIIANNSDSLQDDENYGQYWGDYIDLFKINNKIKIANLETPEIIDIPNSKYKLIKEKQNQNKFIAEFLEPEKLYEYAEQRYVYLDKNSECFVVKAPDGTARRYFLNLDFFKRKEHETIFNKTPLLLNVNWLNGFQNKDEYILQISGGCGLEGCYNYPDYINSIDQLEKIGETEDGEIFYELKNKNFTPKDSKKSLLQEMYDNSYFPGQEKKFSFEEFLATHPIIYWQDPFGNFMELRNAEHLPIAECGKPVIYLYPEEETDVSVWVNPTGGFSITEPAYNNGWKVSASPDSEIYNYSDQKVYPYLFWEGYGINYSRPKEGFVVKRENVKEFLEEKLEKLGLIKKEFDEFIEFWLPKMQDRNYYFVTFVPKPEFDLLAPLTVKPKPDTIIRVFMDYKGLDEYIEVEEQKLFTPQRKGFTVVEWGGALHN